MLKRKAKQALSAWLTNTERKRLVCALVVAALWSDPFTRKPYVALWKALRGMFRVAHGVGASMYVREARLRACRGCPVFFAPLQTCGSPLSKELRDVGCYCQVEAKSRIVDATCWLDEQLSDEFGDAYGWRAAEARQ